MKTAKIRPLTISEQSWRQNKWEEQGHAISRCQNHINFILTHVDWLSCCWITPHHYLWEVLPANNYFQLLVCCFPILLFSFLRNSFMQFCTLLVFFTIQLSKSLIITTWLYSFLRNPFKQFCIFSFPFESFYEFLHPFHPFWIVLLSFPNLCHFALTKFWILFFPFVFYS